MASKIQDYFSRKIKGFFDTTGIDYKKIKNDNLLSISKSFVSSYYYRTLGQDNSILDRIQDFCLMYKDPIVFSALEMMVDDSLCFSPITQKRVWPALKNKKHNKIIEELFDDLDINEKSWEHVARLAMFGNCPIRLYYLNDDFSGGITNIEIEDDMFRYIPIEINGVLIKYIDKYTDSLLEPFQVLFAKINIVNDYNIVNNYYNIDIQRKSVIENDKGNRVKQTFKYGTSMFENSRRLWRQLKLLEDNLILTRLDRAPVIRFFKVKTEGMNSKSAKDMMDFYSDLMNVEDRRLSVDDDLLKGTYGQASFGTNIMFPIEQKGDIEIDQYGGEVDVTSILDIDHFWAKFCSSLKVPLEYLGLDKNHSLFPTGEGKLQRKEIQYARRVKKLQFGGVKLYKDLAFYHLLSLKEDVEYKDIDILMNIVSTAEDEEFKNGLTSSLDNVTKFIELIDDVKQFLVTNNVDESERDYLLDYLTTKILNSNDFDWKDFLTDILKKQEEIVPEVTTTDITGDETLNQDEIKDKNKKITEAKRAKKRFMIENILPKLTKIFEDVKYKVNIPAFSFDNNMKYCRNCFKEKSNIKQVHYIKEEKRLPITEIKKILESSQSFHLSVFDLNYKSIDIDVNNYNVITKENKKVDIKDIFFMEEIFDFKYIMNSNEDPKIQLYEVNNILYCNFFNSCRLFKNYLEKKENKFEILKLDRKK